LKWTCCFPSRTSNLRDLRSASLVSSLAPELARVASRPSSAPCRWHLNSTPNGEISFQRQTCAPFAICWLKSLDVLAHRSFPSSKDRALQNTLLLAFNAPLNGGSRFPMAESTRNKRCRHHLSRVALRIYFPLDFIFISSAL
jgi:hypothetical protein